MSIAEKLTTIADNQQKVFDAGKKDEYDAFWDAFQDYGKRKNYRNAFYDFGYGWNDEIYNPKYPIIFTNIGYPANSTFQNSTITDTKVDIICEGAISLSSTFYNAKQLKTIRKLVVNENVSITQAFTSCNALENITIEGIIGCNLNLQWSPLTVESMKNIISCLKNYSGTDYALTYSLVFNEDCWAALETDSTSPSGKTWREYVFDLGWNS